MTTPLAEHIIALLQREQHRPDHLDTLKAVGLFVDGDKARVWAAMPISNGGGKDCWTKEARDDGQS